MRTETAHDDESLIDTDDAYTDGDGLRWSIVSVNVNERTITVVCHTTPPRIIPVSDLESMKRSGRSTAVDPSEVVAGFEGHYTDQDKLSWTVEAVNLRDRTVTVKLINPPRRTISVEQLRMMRSMKREMSSLLKSGPQRD